MNQTFYDWLLSLLQAYPQYLNPWYWAHYGARGTWALHQYPSFADLLNAYYGTNVPAPQSPADLIKLGLPPWLYQPIPQNPQPWQQQLFPNWQQYNPNVQQALNQILQSPSFYLSMLYPNTFVSSFPFFRSPEAFPSWAVYHPNQMTPTPYSPITSGNTGTQTKEPSGWFWGGKGTSPIKKEIL
jgi:hypothetical protein